MTANTQGRRPTGPGAYHYHGVELSHGEQAYLRGIPLGERDDDCLVIDGWAIFAVSAEEATRVRLESLPGDFTPLHPPVAAPEPDWSEAPAPDPVTGMRSYDWWTVDAGGRVQWHCMEPKRDESGWRSLGWVTQLGDGDDDRPGYVDLPLGVDWRTTLRRRPEVGDE